MTRREDGDEGGEAPRAHLPVESGTQNLEDLEPHQRRIERVASLYFAGCRTVARAITAFKEQLGDESGDEPG